MIVSVSFYTRAGLLQCITSSGVRTVCLVVEENMESLISDALLYTVHHAQHKKASNHHANLPLEMYSFTL